MGSSSCTPIALQFAAIFLRALNDEGTTPNTYELMTEATLEGISSYSAIVGDSISAYSTVHLSVEEYLAQAPQVAALLKNTGGPYQRLLTDINSFHSMLEQAISEAMCSSSLCTYIAVTVTKPPETVVVFLPVDRNRSDCASNRSYYIFDSHSRPQLNIEGSYVAKCSSETNLINRLKLLFPPLDSEGEDNYMMWMYNSFEGTAFALPDELISALAHNIGNSGGEHVTTSAITEEEEVVERSESAINSPPQNHTSSSEVDVNDDEYVIV